MIKADIDDDASHSARAPGGTDAGVSSRRRASKRHGDDAGQENSPHDPAHSPTKEEEEEEEKKEMEAGARGQGGGEPGLLQPRLDEDQRRHPRPPPVGTYEQEHPGTASKYSRGKYSTPAVRRELQALHGRYLGRSHRDMTSTCARTAPTEAYLPSDAPLAGAGADAHGARVYV
ncbi:hypothetical protein DCS_07076 [Drechmeria coniospora]|uniref:Uncharacterized protein n=1 Tax=Drechmeria coniospora TaxID=98403 RepID=A0A151GDG9_DRECN|nr:hypothetical protein DCS_07076 [Drechmeria coniospora]KYK55114.1 hypothetical protein DCS_07076 [Drechmeria coniospora]